MKRVLRWLLSGVLCVSLGITMVAMAQEASEVDEELQEETVEVAQEPDQETIVVDASADDQESAEEDDQQEPSEDNEPAVTEQEDGQADQDGETDEANVAESSDDVQPAQETAELPEDSEEQETIVIDAAADQTNDDESQEPKEDEAVDQGEVLSQEEVEEQSVQDAQEPAQEEPQPELGPDEVMGIDTVDLEDPQGNWLYKRVWWERAESKYEKIRAAVNKILEYRTGFFARRAELDKNVLDPFYIKIGLSQAELQEIINDLIESSEKRAEADKGDFAEKAKEDKQALEKIKEDIEKVVKDDEEVEQAILMLVEQINKVRQVEQQAWQDFKSIARVLDDRKARELFYRVDNAWRNIQELSGYIMGSFTTSFDTLIDRVKQEVAQIDEAVAALKGRGIDLKNKMVEPLDEPEDEENEEPEEKGFFARYITDPISSIGSTVWSIIRWPYDKIMGTTAADEPETEQEQDEQPEEQLAQ